MARSVTVLISPGFPHERARIAADALTKEYDAIVDVQEFTFDLRPAFDRGRGQYLSAALLRNMDTSFGHAAGRKLIGLTEVDLFAPVLTFVFGEAQLDGDCAILSTFRLRNEFYGIPPDEEHLMQRLAKEAVHEAGHLYGLIHCDTFDCVMRSSTYMEEIDLKSVDLCPLCRKTLASVEILNGRKLSRMRRVDNSHSEFG